MLGKCARLRARVRGFQREIGFSARPLLSGLPSQCEGSDVPIWLGYRFDEATSAVAIGAGRSRATQARRTGFATAG
jgi:hypothetical protein